MHVTNVKYNSTLRTISQQREYEQKETKHKKANIHKHASNVRQRKEGMRITLAYTWTWRRINTQQYNHTRTTTQQYTTTKNKNQYRTTQTNTNTPLTKLQQNVNNNNLRNIQGKDTCKD